MNMIGRRSLCLAAILIASSYICVAASHTEKHVRRSGRPLKITVVPWGPTQADVDAARVRARNAPAVLSLLDGNRFRLLSLEYLGPQDLKNPPRRFRVTFYDYTNDRTVTADGDFAGREPIAVGTSDEQPGVSDEELSDAFAVAAADPELRPLFETKKVEFSAAMPPVTVLDGTRLVNIGVLSRATGEYRVVGIRFKQRDVLRYEGGAPPASRTSATSCGLTNAQQPTTGNGTAGQALLTVSDGTSTLWEMLILRPSISSGRPSERSGIEIRDLKYKGKLVMKRGHAPVLNVQYANDFCGPFRDWQYQEGMFNAPDSGATDPAPGIRVLADGQVATTMLETGTDVGNYRGVAVYTQATEFGQEIVLVTEMEAGWYRYMSEWRFAPNGTIRPRYGFGAVEDPCVCAVHMHHAYWRFDFDVVNSANKVFQTERGGRFMLPISSETKIARSYQTNRTITVQNSTGNEAVSIIPNLTDGIADTFASGDFWLLKFQGTPDSPAEIDDPNITPQINIDPWVNGESLDGQDVVVWYGATFVHNDGADVLNPSRSPEVLTGSHVIGPDIRLIRW